jgi:hypothetical protein
VITCLIITYVVVTLGALRCLAFMYRDDVAHSRRHGTRAPKRYQYVAPAIAWPLIWALVPLVVFLVGAVSMSEES